MEEWEKSWPPKPERQNCKSFRQFFWPKFILKHYESIPILTMAGVGLSLMVFFSLWNLTHMDLWIVNGKKFPFDRKDNIVHPKHRKVLHFNQTYEKCRELQNLYNEMDKKEKELFGDGKKKKKCPKKEAEGGDDGGNGGQPEC